LSYTVQDKTNSGGAPAVGNPTYATGAIRLTGYNIGGSDPENLQGSRLVFVYAIQGQSVPPVAGAAFTADFTKGVAAIYSVPAAVNLNDPTTWGPLTAGSQLLYSMSVVNPPIASDKGVLPNPPGDPNFAGQPLTGQNEASFFVASGTHAPGAFIAQQLINSGLLVAPPNNFNGFQAEIDELNALTSTSPYTIPPRPTNEELDAEFAAVAALDPSQNFGSLTPFSSFNYSPDFQASTGDTLQSIGITLYPVLIPTTTTTTTGVPEPASMLLWAGIAAGLGIYRRNRRNRAKQA